MSFATLLSCRPTDCARAVRAITSCASCPGHDFADRFTASETAGGDLVWAVQSFMGGAVSLDTTRTQFTVLKSGAYLVNYSISFVVGPDPGITTAELIVNGTRSVLTSKIFSRPEARFLNASRMVALSEGDTFVISLSSENETKLSASFSIVHLFDPPVGPSLTSCPCVDIAATPDRPSASFMTLRGPIPRVSVSWYGPLSWHRTRNTLMILD